MAGQDRRPTPDLRDDLLREGNSFAFFQALRLLRSLLAHDTAAEHDPLREFVRIRPHLSFAHPPTEIESIAEPKKGNARFLLTATFLGLYGESSPLPSFYTEDLIEEDKEAEKEGVSRDFFDLLNYELYLLFYEAWARHRLSLKVGDEKDPKYLEILFSLLGLGVDHIRDDIPASYQLLRYLGLLTLYPKNATGLRQILSDALEEPHLSVIPCIPRRVKIPEEQRCFLGVSGNTLGQESYLGETIADRTRKYRVKIGPLDGNRFRQLLPGTFKFRRIMALAKIYLLDPYERDLELTLAPGEVKTARLGDARWSRLGYDTWLFSGDFRQPVGAVFELV
jgi:type VI secretion system protein ImpH